MKFYNLKYENISTYHSTKHRIFFKHFLHKFTLLLSVVFKRNIYLFCNQKNDILQAVRFVSFFAKHLPINLL